MSERQGFVSYISTNHAGTTILPTYFYKRSVCRFCSRTGIEKSLQRSVSRTAEPSRRLQHFPNSATRIPPNLSIVRLPRSPHGGEVWRAQALQDAFLFGG